MTGLVGTDSNDRRTKAQRASDYFNSLPIEQRKALAPLLEDYRRMGFVEARELLRGVDRKLAERISWQSS